MYVSFVPKILIGTLFFTMLFGTSGLVAQTPSVEESPIKYRRWLAPVDRFDDWPWAEGRYDPVKRSVFEDLVSRLERVSETTANLTSDDQLTRIVLQARLENRQLVDGRGLFEFRDAMKKPSTPTDAESAYRHYPLSPLGVWIGSPVLNDGTAVSMAQTSLGETVLIVPAEKFKQGAKNQVRFRWSLRSRVSPQGQLLFDFQLPRCLGLEIVLDLPVSIVPTTPVGIVLEDERERTTTMRRWRILLGGQSRTTLTLSMDEREDTSRKIGVRQTIIYTISSQGTQLTTRVGFDKADPPVNELSFELEAPLQPTDVKYGDRPVPWSVTAVDDEKQRTRIHIDLRGVEKSDSQKINVTAQMPFKLDQPWDLPRTWVLSPNIFWEESRAVVAVQRPLSTTKLVPVRATQVEPIASANRNDQDVFAFQYFDTDSYLTASLSRSEPAASLASATQITWGNNETRGMMIVDASLGDGERYSLDFPVSPRWIIDSVKGTRDDVLSWDIVDEKEPATSPAGTGKIVAEIPTRKILSVLLRRPLRPKEPVRLQISGYYPDSTQKDFRLTELVPLKFEQKNGEQNYIALNPDASNHLRFSASIPLSGEMRDPLDLRLKLRYVDIPQGTVLVLNPQTQDVRVRLELLKPAYTAEIAQTVLLKENDMVPTFRIRCSPTDSSVDRVYVHLMARQGTPWVWSGNTPALNPIQTRRLTLAEIEELLASFGPRSIMDDLKRGETWELKLPVTQTKPFEILASTTIPTTEPVPIPLAYLPLAESQKGEVVLTSPREYFYQIINRRLTTVPIAAPTGNRYQETLGTFRYDPREEVSLTTEPALMLDRQNPDEHPPAAWGWSFRLDSQFEADGTVRNTGLFLIENRGKDSLRISFPDEVRSNNIRAVWIDAAPTSWTSDFGVDGTFSIVVPLPERQRFVAVSLEYSFQREPLASQRNLLPRYPTTDIPILSTNWAAWTPQGYDVYTKDKRLTTSGTALFPKAMNELFGDRRYRPFLLGDWNACLTYRQRREQATLAAQVFFDWLGRALVEKETAITVNTRTKGTNASSPEKNVQQHVSSSTWGDALGNEQLLAELLIAMESENGLSRRNSRGQVRVDVSIDRQAMRPLEITPTTPVIASESPEFTKRGTDAFEQAGLVLLVSPRLNDVGEYDYSFQITSFLSAAVHHRSDTELLGDAFRFLPKPLSVSKTASVSEGDGLRFPNPTAGSPQWFAVSQWIKEPSVPLPPWTVAPYMMRLTSISPDWTATDNPKYETEKPLFVVPRNLSSSIFWIVFLTMVVLSWKKPFSSPYFLVLLLFVFEIGARLVVPSYLGVPSGAFLGTAVALFFSLIRPRTVWHQSRRLRERPQQSENEPGSTQGVSMSSPKGSLSFELNQNIIRDVVDRLHPRQSHGSRPSSTGDSAPSSTTSTGSEGNTPSITEPGTPKSSGGHRIFQWFIFGSLLWGASALAIAQGVFADSTTPVAAATPAPPSRSSTGDGESPPQYEIGRAAAVLPAGAPVETAPKETYRVFFPIDRRDRVVGEIVWVPNVFLRQLYKQSLGMEPKSTKHWRIEKAEYQGSLAFDPLTQNLVLANLKATFEIVLDEESTTIQLPSLPLLPDGGKWDQKPIQPTWGGRNASKNGGDYSSDENQLLFNVENQKPGKHQLELALVPQPIRREGTSRVSMSIPKVSNTTLRLTVPPESPPVLIADCLGATTANSLALPVSVSEIGPSGRLTFSWVDEPSRGNLVNISVEQLFKLRARSGQVDVQAVFRYRIDNGKVRQLLLQTDPRWQLSGQFKCAEASIEHVETSQESAITENGVKPPGEITKLVFKTPVSGTITIEAGFVLKGFPGIGRIRPPQITATEARITKSLLAVSEDPLMVVDPPDAASTNGFEKAWKAITVGNNTANGAVNATDDNAAVEERVRAAYDLTKMDSTWMLPVRTKNLPAQLRLNQSVLLNFGASSFVGAAAFTSSGEVFQQTFLAPETLAIVDVEVKNSQKNIVETRWTLSATSVVDGVRMKEYTIFFKKGTSGGFTATIYGQLASTVPAKEKNQRETQIPLLSFPNVQTDECYLNIYRAKSVIVGRQNLLGWQRADFIPEIPASFGDAIFLDIWKQLSAPLPTVAPKTASTDLARRQPTWTILPNNPRIRGEQITSLQQVPGGDGWEFAIDLDWTITEGELDSIRFLWDDQCGAPSFVDPPYPSKLEQKKGRSQLLLSPDKPLSGRQRLRIRVPYNFTGTSIVFPKIVAEWEKKERTDIVQYLALPKEWPQGPISWELRMLANVDAAKAKLLAEKTLASMDDGTRKEQLASTTSLEAKKNDLLESRSFFILTGESGVASIVSQNSRPVASLSDVELFLKKNGDIYGVATVDIQSRGHEGFVLRLPNRFELIQVTCAGIVSQGNRLSDNRWQIDLGASDYPQRIVVLFRGSLASDTAVASNRFLEQWTTQRSEMSVPLPILENVEVRETLWTLAFETKDGQSLPPMSVSALRNRDENDPKAGNEFLGQKTPVAGKDATGIQLRLNLARMENLVAQLEAVPTPLPGRSSEVEHWLSQWSRVWWSLKRMVETQIAEEAANGDTGESFPLFESAKTSPKSLRSFIESIGVPKTMLGALTIREEKALERLGLSQNRKESERQFQMPTNSFILWGESLTEGAVRQFGVIAGEPEGIRLLSLPNNYRFFESIRYEYVWPWSISVLIVGLTLMSSHFRESLRRFPHFWGLACGFGLWMLSSSGILGGGVILLTLFSLAYPAWKQKPAPSHEGR